MGNSTVELFAAIVSAISSFTTLLYLYFSDRRNSVTSTITKERMEWIRQTREALLAFAEAYYSQDKNKMRKSKARLETLMRRDTPEYRLVLEHIDVCFDSKGCDEKHYNRLLGLSAYILTRAWQRVKQDGLKLKISNTQKNDEVTNQVRPMLIGILTDTYWNKDPLNEYRVSKSYGRESRSLVKENILRKRLSHGKCAKIESIIRKIPGIDKCCVICIPHPLYKYSIHVFAILKYSALFKDEEIKIDIISECQKKMPHRLVPNPDYIWLFKAESFHIPPNNRRERNELIEYAKEQINTT